MAAPAARGAVVTAILAKLRASVALTTYVGTRIYPNDDGDATTRTAFPHVQVESGNETPFNTMGGTPDLLKWGSVVRVPIRVLSQAKTDSQGNAMTSVIRQTLDGQPLTVSGYGSACLEFDLAHPALVATRDGCGAVREFLSEYVVTVHQ